MSLRERRWSGLRILAALAVIVLAADRLEAQCTKCARWTPTSPWYCATGPLVNSYLYCETDGQYCDELFCCPGSGCDEELLAIRPHGLGEQTLDSKPPAVAIATNGGVTISRSCAGVITSVAVRSDIAALVKRRTARIVV